MLFKIVRICNSQFKCNYLKHKESFLNFFFHFWKLHPISNISKQKMIVVANVSSILQTVKNLLGPFPKKGVLEHVLTVNMWKRPKYLRHLSESAFTMFLHNSRRIWF